MPSTETILGIAVTAAIPLFLTPPLARAASAAGLIDRRPPAEIARKPRTERVAQVGGLVILIAVAVPLLLLRDPRLLQQRLPVAWPLLAAFLLGTLDDTIGLRPAAKFAGQLVIAALVCAVSETVHPALLFPVTLAALTAFNTYDNADGAATSLAVLALGTVALVGGTYAGSIYLWAAPLGFLWHNLARRAGAAPRAYLGDAGSHLLGVLVALEPRAWVFLTLPLCDLGRLVIVRIRAGQRPWVGDRRHLAHRLQARGAGSLAVVCTLAGIALPPLVLAPWTPAPLAQGLGGAITVLTFAWVLARTPATDAAGNPERRLPE